MKLCENCKEKTLVDKGIEMVNTFLCLCVEQNQIRKLRRTPRELVNDDAVQGGTCNQVT